MSDDVLLTIRITSHPTVQSVLALMLNLSCAGLSLIQLLTFFGEWHACTLDGVLTYTTAYPYTYTPSHLVA